MRYLISICVGLLALILITQIRILGRLDDLARRPVQGVAYTPAPAPAVSASAIAGEIRRQTALEGPPTFNIQFSGASSNSISGLLHAKFRMKRQAGPAKGLSVRAGAGVMVETTKLPGNLTDCDEYELSFKPEAGGMPASWTFSVSYTDHDDKAQERVYEVTYFPGKEPPAYLQITEKHG